MTVTLAVVAESMSTTLYTSLTGTRTARTRKSLVTLTCSVGKTVVLTFSVSVTVLVASLDFASFSLVRGFLRGVAHAGGISARSVLTRRITRPVLTESTLESF